VNYRHAFHAGNFADVMKHVLLLRILVHLAGKEKGFRVVDTHAGTGLYDLSGGEAERTGEWRSGIGRMEAPFAPAVEALLEPYRAVLDAVHRRHGPHTYPGSPSILRERLRPQDRGVLVELHPQDHAVLVGRFNAVANLKVLHLDGWTALHALIPPPERRGLVLIDPPYEEEGELDRLAADLARAARKWPTGIYAGWYPIKETLPVDRAASRLVEGIGRETLRLELLVDRPDDPDRLNGSGLFVVNPPWTLAGEAETVLPALASRLARAGFGAFRVEALR
jgi:23S rRNA (adenine2030-N6)-methyltransferase